MNRNVSENGSSKSSSLIERAVWSILFVYVALVVCFGWNPTPFAQVLAVIAIIVAFIHAVLTYGWKDASVFTGICLVISFTIENIGVATGLPFGHYQFTVGAELPHIGVIPVIVGPLWFGMGYFSWSIAGTLLGPGQRLGGGLQPVVRPTVAAFVMTQWDLVMDRSNSTIAKIWIWKDGGADFGVPLSNYFGWLLTSWLFYQCFAVYLIRRARPAESINKQCRGSEFVPILFYVSAGLTYLTPWLMEQTGQATDATGHTWNINEIRQTTVLVMIFTMGFTATLAAVRLATSRSVSR